jgi:hypothetical protein
VSIRTKAQKGILRIKKKREAQGLRLKGNIKGVFSRSYALRLVPYAIIANLIREV